MPRFWKLTVAFASMPLPSIAVTTPAPKRSCKIREPIDTGGTSVDELAVFIDTPLDCIVGFTRTKRRASIPVGTI